MAQLEGRIEKAALVIKLRAIARAWATETSSKSQETMTNIPPKFSRTKNIGLRPAEANLNNSYHTFDRKELSRKYLLITN